MTISEVFGALLSVLAIAGVAYTLIAARIVARHRALAFPPAPPVPVSVLKPLHGLDPDLEDNLAAILEEDYGAPVQLILGVQDGQSPALAVAQRLIARFPDSAIDLVVDATAHGANRKVSNLINMSARIRHGLVVIADADIHIQRGYLSALTAACAAPGMGVVSCAYVGRAAARGIWSRLAAMGVSYGFFPGVLVGAAGGMASPVMGSTIALRRAVLDEIGGFARLADVLADDHEIGRLVAETGRKTGLASAIVMHECAEASWSALFSQELRWAVTVRTISPWGHYGSVVTHVLPLAAGGALLLGGWAWAIPLVAFGARLELKRQVDQTAGASNGSWLLLPLRDMISFLVFVCSLFARSVRWRGAQFNVAANGTLSPSQGE